MKEYIINLNVMVERVVEKVNEDDKEETIELDEETMKEIIGMLLDDEQLENEIENSIYYWVDELKKERRKGE